MITIPNDDTIELIQNVLVEVRDYFVLSSEYGLNGYLSTSIRHGSLLNFLRSTIDITQVVDFNIHSLEQAIGNLVKNIDEIIFRLADEFIRVNTTGQESNALFHYGINKNDAIAVRYNMKEDLTYDEFVDSLFDHLWKRTDINLINIRTIIIEDIAPKFSTFFTELSAIVDGIETNKDLSPIRDKISAETTKMQTKIEVVLSWFTRKTVSDIKDFNFKLPVNIAETMVKNVNINTKITMNKTIQNTDLFKGDTLKSFVDILYIIFDNVVYHNTNKDMSIDVSFRNSETTKYKYTLEVLNNINEELIVSKVEKKLLIIKDDIRHKLYGHKIGSEGGTGFYKIAKILSYDLRLSAKYYMDFGINEDNQFYVLIEFN